jgi:hypothetical protein
LDATSLLNIPLVTFKVLFPISICDKLENAILRAPVADNNDNVDESSLTILQEIEDDPTFSILLP